MVWCISIAPNLMYAKSISYATYLVTGQHEIFVWPFENLLYLGLLEQVFALVSAIATIWLVWRLSGLVRAYLNSAWDSRIRVTSTVKDGGSSRSTRWIIVIGCVGLALPHNFDCANWWVNLLGLFLGNKYKWIMFFLCLLLIFWRIPFWVSGNPFPYPLQSTIEAP